MVEYKKGKSKGLYKELSKEGRELLNREIESLNEVYPPKDHKEIDRKYFSVKKYLTEGHAGHYWLSNAERMRVTGKRGSNSILRGNSDSVMMEQGPNKKQK